MYRNVNCTFHMKFEHSTSRERINIDLAYIQSLDNLYTFVSLRHVCMFAIKLNKFNYDHACKKMLLKRLPLRFSCNSLYFRMFYVSQFKDHRFVCGNKNCAA